MAGLIDGQPDSWGRLCSCSLSHLCIGPGLTLGLGHAFINTFSFAFTAAQLENTTHMWQGASLTCISITPVKIFHIVSFANVRNKLSQVFSYCKMWTKGTVTSIESLYHFEHVGGMIHFLLKCFSFSAQLQKERI